MLTLYDKNFNSIALDSAIRAIIQSYNGAAHDILVYLRNDDPSVYYMDMLVAFESTDGVTGYLGEDGIYVKFLPGQAEPVEREWGLVLPGESLPLDDIGDSEAADTFSYLPFWIRVYIPGGTSADYKTLGDIKIYYTEKKVVGP